MMYIIIFFLNLVKLLGDFINLLIIGVKFFNLFFINVLVSILKLFL